MKKCSDCNVEMMDIRLHGRSIHIDLDHEIHRFYIVIPTDKYLFDAQIELKTRVCPNCGKVESYVDVDELKKVV